MKALKYAEPLARSLYKDYGSCLRSSDPGTKKGSPLDPTEEDYEPGTSQ